jgi:hypothetical protein
MVSIHKCKICTNLPQKLFIDWEQSQEGEIPPEVKELIVIVNLEDANAGRYESNTTQLMKCPLCGTFYFYNRYTDDGAHFMDPKSNEFTLRRYTPLNAIQFLSGIINRKQGTIPSTLGQLKVAFLDGSDLVRPQPVEEGLDEKIKICNKELESLQANCKQLLVELTSVLNTEPLGWQIKQYIIESINMDCFYRNDLESISKILLHNADPVVRVESAEFIIGTASDDLPVLDIVHIPNPIRLPAKQCLKNTEFMNEIIDVLVDGTKNKDTITLQFDNGYGKSKYTEVKLQYHAFYSLVVLASLYDISPIIPILLSNLDTSDALDTSNAPNVPNSTLIMYICWVLRSFSETKKANAELVLRELEKWGELERSEIKYDKAMILLLKTCRDKLKPKKSKKTTKKGKTTKKSKKTTKKSKNSISKKE